MDLEALKRALLGKAINFMGHNTERVDPKVLTKLDFVRLDSLRWMLEILDQEDVSGDIVEAGTWRGGAAIWMSSCSPTRTVWACDTFAGFPEGSPPYKPGSQAATIGEVQANVDRLANPKQFRFLEGDFKDTLPGDILSISLLHFDGDSPRAIRNVLESLYPKVRPGGFVVIDDYCLAECRSEFLQWWGENSMEAMLMNPYTNGPLHPAAIPCGAWWRE
jgi:hypothetical protein